MHSPVQETYGKVFRPADVKTAAWHLRGGGDLPVFDHPRLHHQNEEQTAMATNGPGG